MATTGAVSFAGNMYRAGRAWRGRSLQVSIVAGSVQLACDGKVVRVHPIRHDQDKEHGAFATPNGRPRKRPATDDTADEQTATANAGQHRSRPVKQVPEPICRAGTGT